ncbi:MAG: tRNA (adenosine(37)-N6)-dimethylallyltransferase MiaA [Clostridium sp.]|nr:tRNA (adenosine(37)-N6)-dimethylallyltransferase MiaA [Clostridium sp.]
MIIAIVGPTGIGKTALSISLAKHYNAEIINFDAMQVYEKMDIGTAKVTKEEMDGVVHHLLSYVDVNTNYSVYDYQKEARSLIDRLLKEKKNIIMVGGTGLYLKATLYDYRFNEEEDTTCYDDLSTEELLKRIGKYNYVPKDRNNRRRLVRELKKLENNIDIDNNGDKLLYDAKIIGLTTDRETLYDRINKRVDIMIENGLVDEVNSLKESFTTSKALKTAIGYKEFIPYFNNEVSLDEVINKIKQNSRHYAKRQYTFFNNQLNVTWYQTDFNNFDNTVKIVIEDLDKE